MTLPSRRLGTNGLTVGAIGLGCMSFSPAYGGFDGVDPTDVIRRAIDLGVHDARHCRRLRPACERRGRGQGHRRPPRRSDRRDQVRHRLRAARVSPPSSRGRRSTCDRRSTDRCDGSASTTSTSTTNTAPTRACRSRRPSEAMAELVAAGKVRYLGLSEASVDTIRRAVDGAPDHRAAERVVDLEPRHRSRDRADVPRARHRHRAVQPARPRLPHRQDRVLRRAPGTRLRRGHPRFTGDAFDANQASVAVVREIADARSARRPARLRSRGCWPRAPMSCRFRARSASLISRRTSVPPRWSCQPVTSPGSMQ